MVLQALAWVVLVAIAVYGAAALLASVKHVPEGKVGIVTDRSGRKRVLVHGMHMVPPFGRRVELVPKGPVRMSGEVRDAVTRDGWRISAHFHMSARLVHELSASEAGDDWRRASLDVATRVLRTELENNDAADLRPRPQALDVGVAEEVTGLTARWGVEVEWLRVTVRWAYAVPPADGAHSPQRV